MSHDNRSACTIAVGGEPWDFPPPKIDGHYSMKLQPTGLIMHFTQILHSLPANIQYNYRPIGCVHSSALSSCAMTLSFAVSWSESTGSIQSPWQRNDVHGEGSGKTCVVCVTLMHVLVA